MLTEYQQLRACQGLLQLLTDEDFRGWMRSPTTAFIQGIPKQHEAWYRAVLQTHGWTIVDAVDSLSGKRVKFSLSLE